MASYVIRTKESNKTSALYLYYYHNRLRSAFAVGFSINPKHLDTTRNKVTWKEPRYDEINNKIEEMEKRIDRIIAANPNIEPTAQWVKEAYPQALKRESIEKVKSDEAKRAEGIKQVYAGYQAQMIEVEEAKVKEWKKDLEASPYKPRHIANNSEKELEATLLKHYDDYVYGKNYKDSTLKTYTAFRKLYFHTWINSHIFKEARSNHSLSLNPIHANLIYSRYFNRFLIDEMKYKDNMMGKTYKVLKQFLSYLETNTDIKVNRQYTKFQFLKDSIEDFIIIDAEEFEMIWDYRTQVTDREEKVLYMMLFSLMTGLRISEVIGNNFTIFIRNNKQYLHGLTFKNDSEALLPMWKDERLGYILNKYNPTQATVPAHARRYKMNLCSAQEFNRISKQIMKKIYELHNIHQQPIKQERSVLGKKITISTSYKWELFTSRSCRRSAITLWRYGWKLTPDQISALIGTKKLEILEIYTSRDKAQKVKLLEDI